MGSQTFNTAGSHNFTAPAGITKVRVRARGAGGGGGSRNNVGSGGAGGGAGGGGGGEFSEGYVTVTPSATYTNGVVVGTGGVTFSGNIDGDDGTASSFTGDSAEVVSANGGQGGTGGIGGAGGAGGTGGTGTYVYAGGAGGTGHAAGGGGGGGGEGGGSTQTGDAGDAGGAAAGGAGGTGGDGGDGGAGGNDAVGSAGTAPGGGGGGGGADDGNARQGGAGADGEVIIDWLDPVIAEKTSSVSRVAPFPITLECTGSSTFGCASDECKIEWEISDPQGVVRNHTITDWLGTAWTLKGTATHKIRGPSIGFVCENIAGTVTVTVTIKNIHGQTDTDTFTISNTGSPDVSYSLRADAKVYRVGSGGTSVGGGGAGTLASPLYYDTIINAINAFSGSDQSVFFNGDETHLVASSEAHNGHHNVLFDTWGTQGVDYTTRAILESSAGGNVVILGAFGTSENNVIRNLRFRNNQAIAAAGSIAIQVKSDNVAVTDCEFIGDRAGNAFTRQIEATDGTEGIIVINCEWGDCRGNPLSLGGTIGGVVLGGSGWYSKDERWVRCLTGGARGCQHLTFFGGDIDHDGGESTKGPGRWQTGDHFQLHQMRLLGGQTDLGFDGVSGRYIRMDGCYCKGSSGTQAIGVYNSQDDLTIVNTFVEHDQNSRQCISKLSSTGTASRSRVRMACLTFFMRHSSTNGITLIAGGNEFNIDYGRYENILFARDAGWASSVFSWATSGSITTPVAFTTCIVPNVADGTRIATVDGVNISYATFTGGAHTFVSGMVREDHDPDDIVANAYRPALGTLAVAGATTPAYVYHDAYGNTRGATSYYGATDAAPGGGGGGGDGRPGYSGYAEILEIVA